MKLMKCLIIFHTTVFCKNSLIEVEDDPKKAKELSSAEMFEAELSTSYEYTSEEEEDKEVLKKKAGKDYDNSPDAKAKSLDLNKVPQVTKADLENF